MLANLDESNKMFIYLHVLTPSTKYTFIIDSFSYLPTLLITLLYLKFNNLFKDVSVKCLNDAIVSPVILYTCIPPNEVLSSAVAVNNTK